MRILVKPLVLACLVLAVESVGAQTLRIAAASDLQFAMNDLARRYEKVSGTRVAVSYGSSGNFRAQIENGAPFDLFFSADLDYPKRLIAEGFAVGGSFCVYARGRLVLWAPAGTNLELGRRGLAALKDRRIQKIAVANPEHAPYGRAAREALEKAGIYDEVKTKLVFGENISQAAQFAQSGSAQVGILALSLTFAESMKGGERWEVPADLYAPVEQAAVVLEASRNKAAAEAFLEFVKSTPAQELLAQYGFTTPRRAQKL